MNPNTSRMHFQTCIRFGAYYVIDKCTSYTAMIHAIVTTSPMHQPLSTFLLGLRASERPSGRSVGSTMWIVSRSPDDGVRRCGSGDTTRPRSPPCLAERCRLGLCSRGHNLRHPFPLGLAATAAAAIGPLGAAAL